MKLLPVHSTCVVTITLVEIALAHMMHVFVFTENTPPLGASGVLVVVNITTWSLKSQVKASSWISHFVSFGPMLLFRGLIYDMFRAKSFKLSPVGDQSDICTSEWGCQWKSSKGRWHSPINF